jgi:hypothetical protein
MVHSTYANILKKIYKKVKKDCWHSPSPVWCIPRNVLGPLLFLTYINDMPEMVKSSETKLFADDSLLFRTINNQADSVLLQNDLTRLGKALV